MTRNSSMMRKVMVLMMAFAIMLTYSVVPMNQSFAASAKKPTKITLNAKSKTLQVGQTFKAKVKSVKPKNASKAVKWKSSNKSVATVNSKGVITAKKVGKATITAVSKKNKKAKASIKVTVKKARNVKEVPATIGAVKARNMNVYIDMSNAKYDGKTVKVWVPVPQTDEYQTIGNISYSPKTAQINVEKVNNNKMLYVEWDKNTAAADRKAQLSFYATRFDVSRDSFEDDPAYDDSEEAESFINKESEYVKVKDPVVQNTAKAIVTGKEGRKAQVRAIYEWIIANLERIDDGEELTLSDGTKHKYEVEGCGYGDTVKILNDLTTYGRAGGHCTDINSTFVALCRAAGIPAREMFGIRLGNGAVDYATGYQHCWAEWYQPGTGWVYADPADVLKAIKSKKGMSIAEVAEAKAGAVCKEKTEYFWGHVDNNRIVLARGRDVTFEPAQAWGVCNTFGYPAAEVDGKRLETSFTDGPNFKYVITGVEPGKADFVNMSADEWKTYGIDETAVRTSDYLIDVRPDAQREQKGFVPGADIIPVTADETTPDKVVNASKFDAAVAAAGDKRIVVVCVSGNKLARNALNYLQSKGVDMSKVTYLIGGFGTWEKVFPVVSSDKKSMSIPAWVASDQINMNNYPDQTHHVLVNEKGSNATKALLNTKAIPAMAYKGLEMLGGTAGEGNGTTAGLNKETHEAGNFIKGSAVNVQFSWSENGVVKTAGMSDFFSHIKEPGMSSDPANVEPYVAKMTFGGCKDTLNDEPEGNPTGCITCTFSCWIGTVSNAQYAYGSGEALVNRDKVPAKDTPITVVYTLG